MSQTAIIAEGLSKLYRIGLAERRHESLVGAVASTLAAPLRNFRQLRRLDTSGEDGAAEDTIWALRDVSFEVRRGEVLGIIGRNGAGKSTLLKVLSRVTQPTRGRIRLRGRVASLLEVGTGFHPDLTGRENVYLNGTILGMTKREIDRKFDEIVAFSEVAKFLDTPVKRYSSGMRVRLAFAVAAHLEPEILIVDEVLAVGDANFQKKCLGKMNQVARGGRTILFVSHNMDAVLQLCTHTVHVKSGVVSERLSPEEGVKQYLALSNDGADLPLAQKPRFQHKERKPIFTGLKVVGTDGHPNVTEAGGPVTFEIEIENFDDLKNITCGVALQNSRSQRVAFFHTLYHSNKMVDPVTGKAKLIRHVPHLPIVPNTYFVELVMADGYGFIERVERADRLEVLFADMLGTGKIPNHNQGYVVAPCDWTQENAA
jgi:lipopolysaccharide transport system ATP-binding protein